MRFDVGALWNGVCLLFGHPLALVFARTRSHVHHDDLPPKLVPGYKNARYGQLCLIGGSQVVRQGTPCCRPDCFYGTVSWRLDK